MGIKQSIITAACSILVVGATLLPSVANAGGYKISMTRDGSDAISRDGILSRAPRLFETKYKKKISRIIHLREKKSPSAPDCHILRALLVDGEYADIHVACGS